MATAAQQASLLRAPPEEDDSPILYRSPLAAHSHRLSRASFSSAALAPPPRPERRRPISLRDPPKGRKAVGQAVDEGEDGEGEGDEETYWRGEVQRRPSVGLGLKFGLDGWEIGEDDEGEEGENVVDEAGEGRAMPADSPSDHPLTTLKETHSDSSPPPRSLTPPLSPVSPTSPPRLSTYTTTTTTTSASPSRHRRSDARPSAVLSRYSSSAASQASTAATSIHEEDEGRDDSDVEGKGSPGTRPALGRFTYSTSSRTGLSVPTVPLPPLTPESLTESAAFDFPLPPGMVLPSPSPAMPLVEEPTPLEDDAAASFALTSSPSYSRPSDAQEDEGAQTRLPSYSSTLSPQPQPRSLSSTSSSRSGTSSSGSRGRHLVVSPRPLDPWVLDPAGTDGLDEEDRAILGAVLPMALEAEEEEEEELEDEDDGDMRTMGRSPHLVPLPLSPPQQPTRLYPPSRTAVASGPRTPPNRSPSMPAISPPPSSSSRLGNLFPKSPSFTFGTSPSSAAAPSSSAKASPPLLSPPKSPDTGRNGSSKRSSMLLSPLLAGIGQLGRSRSKSGSNASLSSGGGKGRGLSSVVETASSTRSSSSASSGTRSVTDQLASSRLLSPTSPPASSLAPSLLPAADIDVDLRASSSSRKAAKMLGVDQETVLRSSSSSSLSRSPYGTARSSPAVSPGASPEMGNEPFPRAPPFPSTGRRRPAPLDLLPPAGQAPPGSPARPSPSSVASASKAAKMLGLSEEEVGRAVLSPRGSWEGSRKREEGAQRWPAQREAIREHEIFSGDLYKLSSTPSTLLRQGKLSYRPRVVTLSYAPPLPASTSSPISPFSSPPSNLSSKPSFFLSTYPTPALLEHETSRLTLLPSSHISAPLEGETLPLSRGGRAFALKVTGVVDALANDGSGRVERRKGAWVLGVDDQGVWGEWMGRLRGAVKELQEAAPLPLSGTETPSSASFPYESALPLTPSPPTVSAETFDLDTARLSAAASVRSSTAGKGVAMDFAQTEKAILSSNGWAVTGGPAGAAGSSSTASGSGSGASGLVRSGTTGSTMSRRSQASVGHGSSGSGRGPRSRNPSLAHSTRSAPSIAAPSLGSRASSILDLAPYASYVDYAYSSSLRGEEEGDEADQEDFYATEAAERYFFSAASSVREGETSSMREAHSGEQTARVEQLASFLDAESSSDELECGGGGNDGKEEKTALVPLPPLPTQLAAQRPSLSPPPSLLSPRHRTFSASLAPPPLSPPPQTALPPLPPSASRSGSVASLPPATANRRISAAIQFQGSLPASPPPKGGLPALPVVTRA